ncbi:hypothetical protein V1511DRAFT_507147 [Dipodascopsis uninucleata]
MWPGDVVAAWFTNCCWYYCCCCCGSRTKSNQKSKKGRDRRAPPAYYMDFDFYAEQIRERNLRPGSFGDDSGYDGSDYGDEEEAGMNSCAAVEEERSESRNTNLDNLDTDSDEDEFSELLSSRGRSLSYESNYKNQNKWSFGGISCLGGNRRKPTAIYSLGERTTTRKPSSASLRSTDSLASFLVPSRIVSGGRLRSANSSTGNVVYDGVDRSQGTQENQEQYEDFGIADAQIVPDNFVVSVPLRPTSHSSFSEASSMESVSERESQFSLLDDQ